MGVVSRRCLQWNDDARLGNEGLELLIVCVRVSMSVGEKEEGRMRDQPMSYGRAGSNNGMESRL